MYRLLCRSSTQRQQCTNCDNLWSTTADRPEAEISGTCWPVPLRTDPGWALISLAYQAGRHFVPLWVITGKAEFGGGGRDVDRAAKYDFSVPRLNYDTVRNC